MRLIKLLEIFWYHYNETFANDTFIFNGYGGSVVVIPASLAEPSFMTINIGSDLMRPLPDGLY